MTPTQELVLDCYRSPELLRSLSDAGIPLPEGMDRVLRDAIVADSPLRSLDAAELRQATLAFVNNVVLVDGADHYRTLGLRFNATPDQIDAHYRLLVGLLQLDTSMSTRELSRRVGRISRAHAVLSDARRRHAYDKARFGALVGENADLPVEILVQSILDEDTRSAPIGPLPTPPPGGALQPWAPEVADGQSGAARGARQRAFEAGTTHQVFRGPSDAALLAMSGAALLVIFAVSPFIVARYAPYFMPPERVAGTSQLEPAALLTPVPRLPAAFSAAGVSPVASAAIQPDDAALAEDMEDLAQGAELESGPEVVASAPQPQDQRGSGATAVASAAPVPATAGPPFVPRPDRGGATAMRAAPAPPQPATDKPAAGGSKFIASAASLEVVAPPLSEPLAPAALNGMQGDTDRSASALSAGSLAVAVPVRLIDSYDLDRLIERFAATYRDGDADAFLSLFAEDARTNDQPDRVGIAEDYLNLFKATERRSLHLDDLTWQRRDSGAVGEGRFVVRIKPKWKKREEVVSGRLTLEVERQERGLAITGLFHDYGPLPRP